MNDAFRHCERLIYQADKDRFLATLFAPDSYRPALHALYAFNAEIARVREIAREPLPGEIRLQWWNEVLAGERTGEAQANPVAAALLATVERYRLSVPALIDLIEARRFDLYDDPMPTKSALEDYGARTSAALIDLAARILTDGDDPGIGELARQAGIAHAMAGLLRALPIHAARRQLYLPLDILREYRVDPESIFSLRATDELVAALAQVRRDVRAHLDAARKLIGNAPPAIGPALLPVALVEPLLRRLERARNPFETIEPPQWRRQWILWRAARDLRVRL
jgi:phytoene synthase